MDRPNCEQGGWNGIEEVDKLTSKGMKIDIRLSAISIFLTANSFSQTPNYLWATRAGVNGATANSVVTDASENVIVAGNFIGASILFGTTTLTNAGGGNSSDIFVAKYDTDGNVLWAKKQTGGGTGSDQARGVAVDASGNVLVTGTFTGPNIVFGTTTLINAGGGSSTDLFLVKYDPDGNVLWARKQTAGGTAYDVAKSVATDAGGNVIVTGNFDSPAITFGTTTLTNAGANDVLTVKYDPDGNVLWAKQQEPGGAENNDVPYRIASDASGNVIITGNFESPTITFGTTTLTQSTGTYATDLFVVKYDPDGNVLWAKQQDANGSANELGAGIAADPSGNIIVSGWFDSPTVTFGTTTLTNGQSPSSIDLFIVKFDCDGNVLWARQQDAGGTSNDNAINVTADARGNIIVTGYFEGGNITFGTTTLTNAGVRDLFVVGYDPAGNALWAKQQDAGGAGTDVGQSVASDASGNVVVAGVYTAQTDPAINITFDTTTLGMPPGNPVGTPVNMFVAKLGGTQPFPDPPAPFYCDTSAYLFMGDPTRMYRLDLNSGVSQLVADPVISSPCDQGINACGFNTADNCIWGYRLNTNQIVRIAADYSVSIFSIAGLPIKNYNSGDISDNGIMYLYAGNDLDVVFYRIDLNLLSPQLILPVLSTTPTLLSDWAISPMDDALYTIASNTFAVYRFDASGNRTFVGNATGGGVDAGGNYGGIFMDNDGNMYALNNDNGNIFKIDQPHTGNTTATLFSQGPVPTVPVDGASNITLQNAPLITLTNDTSICGNTSIQLNASASSGNITWQADPTLSCVSCNDPLASPITPTTYIVTATNNGCTSRDSVSIAPYTSSLLAVSSDTSICEGASATLNADPDFQVNWSPTSGLSCTACTTTSAAPAQTTTYIATTDLGACLLSDSVTITVDTITPILLSNDTVVCVGDTVQLNATTDASAVQWFPAEYLSCDDCSDPVCIPVTNVTYLVTAQNVACPDSALISISVNLPPEVSLTNTPVTCSGAADGSATATVVDGAVPLTYLWSPGGGTDTAATGLSAGSYLFTITDANGCSSSANVQIDEPTPVTVVAFDTLICNGSSAALLAQANGGSPGYTFSWSPDGPDVAPDATASYTVIATDTNGCLSLPDTTVVTVPQVPQPVFAPDSNGCAPLCIPFAADAVPDLSYAWDFGDGNTANGVAPLHCYPDPGSYSVSVTVTDTNGCSNALLRPDLMTVRPSPTAAFNPSATVTTLDRSTVQFTDQSTDAQSWFWQFGDAENTTSTSTSPNFRFPAVDCYTVTLTVTNAEACTDTTSREICIVDIPAVFIPNSFTPDGDGINDSFRVMIAGAQPRAFEFTVFDRWGGVIFSTATPDFAWDGAGTPIGTYPWKLSYQDLEVGGKEYFGHVTLVR